MAQLPKRYNHKEIEEKWLGFWLRERVFEPRPGREPFVIMMPPPNVTGIIHMGHVLDNTLQDILARWRRMQGHEVLWQPGIDHAGIATHNVVERELAKEGKTRWDVGREEFLRRVWAWKEKYGHVIVHQLQRLGASAAWERLVFTMDPAYSRAVLTAFVRLFNKGLIYRGKRLVNWCPRCHTALSDDEVEREERPAKLYYIRYPLADGEGEVVVATTRPESYLGDTGVAVHPDDERYKHLIGKKVKLPLINWERVDLEGNPVSPEVPIVASRLVDPEFGTGAVKVTPAHDPADWEMGEEAGLPKVLVIDEWGNMNENAGPFRGLDRFEARRQVAKALAEAGFLVKEEDYTLPLGVCYRCKTPIEPYPSEQWFIKMKPLAEMARRAVERGEIRIIPEFGVRIYNHWLDNIKDWCISRQIWWGHRIPVFHCEACGHTWAQVEAPEKCPNCGSQRITQDPDVLDTWASSWLWPFATLGWPDQTPDLKKYYPTSVLITGWDILFFWVARMIMAGYEFTGKPPFRTVYLHGILRDEKRRKLSKSLGNFADPLYIFDKYSVDGVRMGLMLIVPEGQDMIYTERVPQTGRNFATKLWNAARLILMSSQTPKRPPSLRPWDRWILSRLDETIAETTRLLEEYDFSGAARLLYDFAWHEFCDWYLEGAKPRLGREGWVALVVLENLLRLLHPIMPYITEELWHRLPDELREHPSPDSIALARWPRPLGLGDPEAVEGSGRVRELVQGIRELRGVLNLPKAAKVPLFVGEMDEGWRETLALFSDEIKLLGGVSEIREGKPKAGVPLAVPGLSGWLSVEGADPRAIIERLTREKQDLLAHIKRLSGRLESPQYRERAPKEVQEAEARKLAQMKDKLARIEGILGALGS